MKVRIREHLAFSLSTFVLSVVAVLVLPAVCVHAEPETAVAVAF
jgi:hypothetical protein